MKIKVNVSDPANVGGFKILCANGLVVQELHCGQRIPTIPPDQFFQIANNTFRNLGWKEYTYSFTPASNFGQVWIYPYTSSGTQIDLLVDYVKVCPTTCFNQATTDITYSSGQIPIGTTQRRNIYVGTLWTYPPGATVNISSTSQTTLLAENEIYFKSQFDAVVSSGSFIAKINNCAVPNSGVSTRTSSFLPQSFDSLPANADSSFSVSRTLKITEKEVSLYSGSDVQMFPNPVEAILHIKFPVSWKGEMTIKLINNSGIIIRKYKTGNKQLAVGIDYLPAGVYYIQISDTQGNISTRKFVKAL